MTTDLHTRPERVDLADGDVVDVWTTSGDDRITITAWDEIGRLVGHAWCDAGTSDRPRRADIEVTPSHRTRGIGQHLLRCLINEASARGIAALTWTHPADDLAVRHLADASDGLCARRVDHGRARSTIFVPAA